MYAKTQWPFKISVVCSVLQNKLSFDRLKYPEGLFYRNELKCDYYELLCPMHFIQAESVAKHF